jgi:hypothetical protein
LKEDRLKNNRDCLVFNECFRLLKLVSSEVSSFDYGLRVTENSTKDPKKIKMAQKIFEHMILSDDYKNAFSRGIVTSLRSGYSIASVSVGYENEYTIQMALRIKFLNNPEFAFFDKKSIKAL